MKSFKMWLIGFFALALNCFVTNDALACACCAEPGEYSINVRKPDDYVTSQLKKMRFAKTANLFTGPAAPEDITRGLLDPSEQYSLSGAFSANNLWQLTFRDGGSAGILKLPLPAKMLNFKADIHDSDAERGDPNLYKEWRFEGVPQATGIFQAGIVPLTRYFLVLQGRGNACDSAEDFTHWRLEITGRKASYAFYGKLTAPVAAAAPSVSTK